VLRGLEPPITLLGRAKTPLFRQKTKDRIFLRRCTTGTGTEPQNWKPAAPIEEANHVTD